MGAHSAAGKDSKILAAEQEAVRRAPVNKIVVDPAGQGDAVGFARNSVVAPESFASATVDSLAVGLAGLHKEAVGVETEAVAVIGSDIAADGTVVETWRTPAEPRSPFVP